MSEALKVNSSLTEIYLEIPFYSVVLLQTITILLLKIILVIREHLHYHRRSELIHLSLNCTCGVIFILTILIQVSLLFRLTGNNIHNQGASSLSKALKENSSLTILHLGVYSF